MKRRHRGEESKLDTYIGANTMLEGRIHTELSVSVEGRFSGTIEAKGEVSVGSRGNIEGDIIAGGVYLAGHVVGTVTAHRLLQITATGGITGNVVAKKIMIAEGGVLDGTCRMTEVVEAQPNLVELLPAEA